MEEKHRTARRFRFSSSKIVALTANGRAKDSIGAPFYTYVDEIRLSRKMGCSLEAYAYGQAMQWGLFMEDIAYDFMPLTYRKVSNSAVRHPDPEFNDYWAGACDFVVPNEKVIELKCYQKKAFAHFTECLLRADVEEFKKKYPQEYWQIVSNCILNQVDIGEAVSFMPYRSTHPEIVEIASDPERWGADQWKVRFIAEQPVWKLPFLPDDSGFKNINGFTFVVPQEDKDFLTERVRMAIVELNKHS